MSSFFIFIISVLTKNTFLLNFSSFVRSLQTHWPSLINTFLFFKTYYLGFYSMELASKRLEEIEMNLSLYFQTATERNRYQFVIEFKKIRPVFTHSHHASYPTRRRSFAAKSRLDYFLKSSTLKQPQLYNLSSGKHG